MSKSNAAAKFSSRLKNGWIVDDDWASLSRLGAARVATDVKRNSSLAQAFKKAGLDPAKDNDWRVLCALFAEAHYPPQKRRGRRVRWDEAELLKAFMYGKPLGYMQKQRVYEALSRLRKDDPDLARRIKRLRKGRLTE